MQRDELLGVGCRSIRDEIDETCVPEVLVVRVPGLADAVGEAQ